MLESRKARYFRHFWAPLSCRTKQAEDIWALGWILHELATGQLPPPDCKTAAPDLPTGQDETATIRLPKRLSEVLHRSPAAPVLPSICMYFRSSHNGRPVGTLAPVRGRWEQNMHF